METLKRILVKAVSQWSSSECRDWSQEKTLQMCAVQRRTVAQQLAKVWLSEMSEQVID